MALPTSIYFLVHRNHTVFKIGVAKNTINRIFALGGLKHFDLKLSYEIILSSEREAFNSEKTLHFLLEAYKADAPAELQDGYTVMVFL